MPCTTILVGKQASYDGSTLMARNEDSSSGKYAPKKMIVVMPEEQPRNYRSVLSGVEISLPDCPMRYTAMPNAIPDEGIWGEAGINEVNIAMSATETLTSNSRVLGADPLVKEGIGEEDLLTIVLPYIRSAREGVSRLGALLEEYGTYEMNGIGFQDVDEIWWFETVGGHHWIARRVPDNAYVIMPNQLGIDTFDLTDAFGKQENHMCSADLLSFIQENHLDLSMDGIPLETQRDFDPRGAFGSHSDSDHVYNTPRAWYMARCLNPNTYLWDGENADYTPESDDIPWCFVPERKITIEDIKYVLSSYYQGTPYNPYAKPAAEKGPTKYRPIGINRNNFVAVTQLRPYCASEIMAVEWIAVGSNAFNSLVPFYANIRTTPAYLSETSAEVTTENFYWANRIIACLADAHYHVCLPHIERYELALTAYGHKVIGETDKQYLSTPSSDPADFLAQVNQKTADYTKAETDALLAKVLYSASNKMTNRFALSDS